MDFNTTIFGKDKPFAHMFFFQLSDSNQDLVKKFIDLCVKYLSHHPGQQHFSVGCRALQIDRDVSAKNFEISMHMVFKDFAAYTDYTNSPLHEDFITESAGMATGRVVFDSFLQKQVTPRK